VKLHAAPQRRRYCARLRGERGKPSRDGLGRERRGLEMSGNEKSPISYRTFFIS